MVGYLKKYWYIIVLTVSLSGNYFLFISEDDSYIKEYEDRIEALESRIDSLKTKNVGLKSEIIELEKQSDSLDILVVDLEDRRKSIIRSYEIYLQQITDLDDSELERWILSRYNDRTGVSSSTVRY